MTTPSGLFILKEDGALIGLSETEYEAESLLQELLAKYPELMPGDQIDSAAPRRWLRPGAKAAVRSSSGHR